MILREAIRQVRGFRYMIEQLDICSAVGRRVLYDLPWLDSKSRLEAEFERIQKIMVLFEQPENESRLERLTGKLMQVRDIRGTIGRMAMEQVLDDLELFELKTFALCSEEIRELVEEWRIVLLPELEPVARLLDPEGNRIPHFYIYDTYSAELARLRAEIKQKSLQGAEERELEALYVQSVVLEDKVREELSVQLRPYHDDLKQALEAVGLLDVVLAIARQAIRGQLTLPQIPEEGEMVFEGLFHPQIREILEQEGRAFQAVDLKLEKGTTVITGANMAGKTVLLKSVQLAQYLMQFGFYVPARRAGMPLVEQVLTSIGDDQDELNGLSSYAAEMLRVDEMIRQVRQRSKILVLIDELARTTNPVEGRAIVNGVVDFLTTHRVMAMVTTHYSGITAECRKLRVRGFVENRVEGNMTLKNINEFIDYSLEEDSGEEVPQEAMRIAWMLGIDRGVLERVENYLQEENPDWKKTVQ